MDAFEWHSYIIQCMKNCKRSELFWVSWDDLFQTKQEIKLLEHKEKALLDVAESLGLTCTVTLQLPSDTRKVRLLKDGQPPDPGEQCEGCDHFYEVNEYTDACFKKRVLYQEDCPDWDKEQWFAKIPMDDLIVPFEPPEPEVAFCGACGGLITYNDIGFCPTCGEPLFDPDETLPEEDA